MTALELKTKTRRRKGLQTTTSGKEKHPSSVTAWRVDRTARPWRTSRRRQSPGRPGRKEKEESESESESESNARATAAAEGAGGDEAAEGSAGGGGAGEIGQVVEAD
uniref:Uncharacterized protein n=1 Tax=Oryza meridionalis TaxID=40149 RepID=A0A0E0EVM1_9ORYZ